MADSGSLFKVGNVNTYGTVEFYSTLGVPALLINGIQVAGAQQAAVPNITSSATVGTLPTPDGIIVIANAATPTVTELLEYCVELENTLESLLAKLRLAGVIAP